MDCQSIVKKAVKYEGDKTLCIDTNRITAIELKLLEQNGYSVKLFNQPYLKKPYYQISKKTSNL
ncbi:hypothetical protein [Clostridium botulinum]|uniref:hypothetical protein n=1 Tax=Clostridium botulinum TaxID=1491 RepID=UPI00174E5E30|nr:hypothetical protein [Clostridium botulinum]MBD5589133.1 hypothetical protein [Clostridium botulinum]